MPEILQRLQASLHVGDRRAERTEARPLTERRDFAIDPSAIHVVRVKAEDLGGYWAVCSCGKWRSLECDRASDAARLICPWLAAAIESERNEKVWRARQLDAHMNGVVR